MLVCVFDLLGHVRLVLFPLDVAKRRSLGNVLAELHCREGVLLGGDSTWVSGRRASLCAVCTNAHPVGRVTVTSVAGNLVQVCVCVCVCVCTQQSTRTFQLHAVPSSLGQGHAWRPVLRHSTVVQQ